MGSGKPRGIRAGRKLSTKRRLQKYQTYLSPLDGMIKTTTPDFCVPDSKTPSWDLVWQKG